MKKAIPLMVPSIEQQDIDAVSTVLRSGMLVQGKQVESLEKKFTELTGSRHAVAVSNGTATLQLALQALGIGPGDEVIIPAFSYIATANVVELVRAKPVFVDIDIRTFNIDITKIEAAITSKVKAIIPVHEFGLACEIEALIKIARRHNLLVIEDAACALGATENGKQVGTFGTCGSFSLHPRKNITSGEGGVITTNNAELQRSIRILRNHGIDPDGKKMDFVAAGYNYRMTEFQAALVNSQFPRLGKIIDRKNQLAGIYYKTLVHPYIELPYIPAGKKHTWQTFHVLLKGKINRDVLIERLKMEGIGTNNGAQCIPAQTYFREKYKLKSHDLFPNAMNAYENGLAIPLYEKLSEEDIKYISSVIKQILD